MRTPSRSTHIHTVKVKYVNANNYKINSDVLTV